MITIAGSGPSTEQISHVDVATKKQSIQSDYVFCRFGVSYRHKVYGGHQTPLMIYYRRNVCGCKVCNYCKLEKYHTDSVRWNKYYKRFSKIKPSTGLCAVFSVVERWKPETIGLIGFDGILDGYPGWQHDAENERKAILSLVNIEDLRK